jgi:hypothetical protein
MPTLSQLLACHGIAPSLTTNIEPHRDHQGVWGIKFSAPGKPAGVLMDLANATTLAGELRTISAHAIAERIDTAASKAKRFMKSPSPR